MQNADDTGNPELLGLRWARTLWGLEPRWTVDPDMTVIMETVKSTLNIRSACSIEFLGGGAFNKLCIVKSAENEVIARVTLAVEPKWKTLSEVATLRWVRQNTSLPVPDILGFDADRGNPIGFEWIIVTKVPGKPWADAWREIPFPAKEESVRQIASFCSDTFAQRFYGIGNLFPSSTPDQGPNPPKPEMVKAITETKDSFAANEPPNEERPGTDDCFNRHSGPVDVVAPSIPGFTVQRMVSSALIGVDVDPKISRGPFATSREWLSVRLDLAESDRRRRLSRALGSEPVEVGEGANGSKTAILEPGNPVEEEDNGKGNEGGDSDDGEDDEDAEDGDDDPDDLECALEVIAKLRVQMPNFFPPGGPEIEPSVIYHDDMNRHNILVDDAGALTAVVDWECVSALPLYAACQYPPFLQGKPLEVEPVKSKYQHDENGDVVELYWEHLEDYELTQLRRLFLGEMQKLQPEWASTFSSSQRQRDYDLAVASCDDPFMTRRIMRWLNDLESGAEGVQGLGERIDNGSM